MPTLPPMPTCTMGALAWPVSVQDRRTEKSNDGPAFLARYSYQNVRVGGGDARADNAAFHSACVEPRRMAVEKEKSRQSINTTEKRSRVAAEDGNYVPMYHRLRQHFASASAAKRKKSKCAPNVNNCVRDVMPISLLTNSSNSNSVCENWKHTGCLKTSKNNVSLKGMNTRTKYLQRLKTAVDHWDTDGDLKTAVEHWDSDADFETYKRWINPNDEDNCALPEQCLLEIDWFTDDNANVHTQVGTNHKIKRETFTGLNDRDAYMVVGQDRNTSNCLLPQEKIANRATGRKTFQHKGIYGPKRTQHTQSLKANSLDRNTTRTSCMPFKAIPGRSRVRAVELKDREIPPQPSSFTESLRLIRARTILLPSSHTKITSMATSSRKDVLYLSSLREDKGSTKGILLSTEKSNSGTRPKTPAQYPQDDMTCDLTCDMTMEVASAEVATEQGESLEKLPRAAIIEGYRMDAKALIKRVNTIIKHHERAQHKYSTEAETTWDEDEGLEWQTVSTSDNIETQDSQTVRFLHKSETRDSHPELSLHKSGTRDSLTVRVLDKSGTRDSQSELGLHKSETRDSLTVRCLHKSETLDSELSLALSETRDSLSESMDRDSRTGKSRTEDMPIVETAHFPQGFGVYLTSHCDFDDFLLPFYTAIMQVHDLDTRDKLLCFLDDFKRRNYILKTHLREQKFLLHDVHLALSHAMDEIKDCAVNFHDDMTKVMYANEILQEFGTNMLESMFTMMSNKRLLDMELTISNSALNFKPDPNKFPLVTEMLALVNASRPKKTRSARSKFCLLDARKKTELKRLTVLLEELRFVMWMQDLRFRLYEEMAAKRRADITTLQQGLKRIILDLENQNSKVAKTENFIAGADITIRVRLLQQQKRQKETKDASTQTDSRFRHASQHKLSAVTRLNAVRSKISVSPIGEREEFDSKNKTQNASEDTGHNGAENFNSSTREQSEDDTPTTHGITVAHRQPSAVYVEDGLQADNILQKEDEGTDKLITSSGNACNNANVDNTEYEAPAELQTEALDSMITSFNDLLLKHVERLQGRVRQAQKEAEQDKQWVLNKQLKLSALLAKLAPIGETMHKHLNALPTLELSDTQFVINNRPAVHHTCHNCMCESFPCMLEVDRKNAARLAGRTLDYAHSYVQALDQLRASYTGICSQLAQTEIQVLKEFSASPWNSGIASWSRSRSASTDFLRGVTAYSTESYSYTKELIATLGSMTVYLITKTREAQTQLDVLKQYKTYLDEVFDQVEHLCLTAAVQLARLRSQQQVLRVCRVLQGCRCPSCLCYMSPFRNIMNDQGDDDEPLVQQMKKRLNRVVHCLAQGTSTVTAPVGSHDTTPQQIVTGINPETMDQLVVTSDALCQLQERLKPLLDPEASSQSAATLAGEDIASVTSSASQVLPPSSPSVGDQGP